MLRNRHCLIACFALADIFMVRATAATVSYTVQFQATWSSSTHPGAYPPSAHFSALIGGVHNDQVNFWAPGGLATPGIEQMAELGGTTLLRGEIQSAITAGSAAAIIAGSNVNSPGSTTVSFDVSSTHPLVTLVTMVAPTPDWFVGVHGLDLRDGAGWKNEIALDLYAYDAGTEEGVGFSLANDATVPPQPIALLTSPLSASDPPLARLTFTRTTPDPPSFAADFDGDSDVDGADFLTWQRGLGTTSAATQAEGDANGDQKIDASDLALWKTHFGGATSAVQAPEPSACGLLLLTPVVLRVRRRIV
jgi:hypothetical protein